jgi:hypothetical protein
MMRTPRRTPVKNYFDYERERRRKEVEAISGFADPRRGWEIIERRRKARERTDPDTDTDDPDAESPPPSTDKPEDEPMRRDTRSVAGD